MKIEDLIVGSSTYSVAIKTSKPAPKITDNIIEGSDITVTLSNYNSEYRYTLNTTGGVINSTYPFTWTLPAVTGDSTHTLVIKAEAYGQAISDTELYEVTVLASTTYAPDGTISTDFTTNTASFGLN